MPIDCHIAVIGAGAAGIWAAERAAREGADTVLIEKTPRVGTKILASGGQKCNLTTTRGPRDAERLYGERAGRFLRHSLMTLPPRALRDRFHELGVPTREAPLEKVFPVSERAVDVRDALEDEARQQSVDIRLESPVTGLRFRDPGWSIDVDGRPSVTCHKALVCPGGRSYPGTGTTGDGYGWAESLDLSVVTPVPHLVGLTSPSDWVHDLAGVDIQGAEARIVDDRGAIAARRRRPVLFTHDGVSGPGAMDLAEYITRPLAAGVAPDQLDRRLQIDTLPDIPHDDLREQFGEAARQPGAQGVRSVLPDDLPGSLFEAICHHIDLDPSGLMVDRLAAGDRNRLIDRIKALDIRIDGSQGFDHAEVTAGGIDLDDIDPTSMRVKHHDDLYMFGEILDATGPIGGLNFQAAWSEAEVAATSAVQALVDEDILSP
jgi:predicted Rossmann fold flavoprotein